ncbi:MAG: hypothetical protein M0Z53_05995 [Thermaerobacter sp.]|nr:hypothetical protein [Thermaerobacter sp.]
MVTDIFLTPIGSPAWLTGSGKFASARCWPDWMAGRLGTPFWRSTPFTGSYGGWQQYQASESGLLPQHATGLEKDFEAVKNSLIYPEVRNGALEGVNIRLASHN